MNSIMAPANTLEAVASLVFGVILPVAYLCIAIPMYIRDNRGNKSGN
jgi:hypothetical protein